MKRQPLPRPDVPAETLERIASAAVGAEVKRIRSWRMMSIHAPFNGATGGVFRVTGRGSTSSGDVPWSVILKVIRPPGDDLGGTRQSATSLPWKREALIYESGVLERLEGLRAPRCHGIDSLSDTTVHIWLEDIAYPPLGTALPQHCDWLARRFGEFNAAHSDRRSLLEAECLGRDGLRAIVAGYAVAIDDLRAAANDTLVKRWWPDAIRRRTLRLWEEREVYLDALDRLPEMLCHGDLFSRNVLIDAGHRVVVAVDWSFAGVAPVGSELAPMVAASVFFGDVEPQDLPTVSETAWLGYLNGLHTAGWTGSSDAVRFGYAATAALRYGLFPLPVLMRGSIFSQRLERIVRLPAETILQRWAAAARFLLDVADEARSLLDQPG